VSYAKIGLKLQSRRKKLILTTKPALVIQWILFASMGASICWAAYEADTQFTIFDLSALKKQCLISPGRFCQTNGPADNDEA
jgi:hypothetical protein